MSAGSKPSGAWGRLASLASRSAGDHLRDLAAAERRFDAMSLRVGGLLLDFSRQRVTRDTIAALTALAAERQLPQAVDALFRGDIVNVTEGRAALHTALRAPAAERPPAVADAIEVATARFLAIAEALRRGERRGSTGKPFRHVVHIGIGGSELGPRLATEALAPGGAGRFDIRFLANLDGRAAFSAFAGLDPAETLVVVVSKSFRTRETLLNAHHARSWFLERMGSADGIAQHFMAVTADAAEAQRSGLGVGECLPMWDWLGGRQSLWSAAGLPVALAIGAKGFRSLLAGAHAVDRHFQTARPDANGPILLALLGLWNANFLGAAAHAVLPYDERLATLPAHLQQLEMESNGKSVCADGSTCDAHTVPLVWGGEETNGQHAFHQWLLQSTRACSVDFVAVAAPGHDLAERHRWLLANCLAQGQALAGGRPAARLGEDPLAAHRAVPGNQPSTTILLDALTPQHLGSLLALYEHKTFCQGVLWGINPFDQWGVELGKALADTAFAALDGGARTGMDVSAAGLVDALRHSGGSPHD